MLVNISRCLVLWGGGPGGGGGGGVSVQSMGEMGKDFCPNFLQPFLENIDICLKVAILAFLELGVFTAFCGLWIDACSLVSYGG